MAERIITHFYALIDEEGCKRYIGKTVLKLSQRLTHHLKDAKRGDLNHRCHWLREQMALDRIVRIELLEDFDGPDWAERERWWIKRGRELGWPLTNNTEGGEGSLGHRHRPETKAKIAAIRKAKPSTLTEAGRERLAERMRGNTQTLGYRASAETRAKLSAIHKGRKQRPETIAKRTATKTGVSVGKGIPKSDAWKAKMAEYRKTPESKVRFNSTWRENLRASKRRWWATSPKADACREDARRLMTAIVSRQRTKAATQPEPTLG